MILLHYQIIVIIIVKTILSILTAKKVFENFEIQKITKSKQHDFSSLLSWLGSKVS